MLLIPLREKNKILAQRTSALTRRRLSWLIFMSSLPLFGVVTAFGIAPGTSFKSIPIEAIVRDLSIPDILQNTNSNSTYWHQENIQRGDTISAILTRLEIKSQDKVAFLSAARESKAMRRLMPGKTIYAQTTAEGELLMMRYFFGNEELFLMEKVDHVFQMSEQQIELDAHIRMRSGRVNSSLFGATDRAGVPNNIAMQITEIFASEIDFHRDLRQGDRFTVVYETLHNNGEQAKTGRILAAEYINEGKSHKAIYFQAPNGEGGYYTPEGISLQNEFLRSPLTFSRVSSGFSNSRFHPVLKKWRSHRGIDYAAPTGTPVKATASGTVSFAGTQGGYGNLVVLRHRGKYDTAYGHLSRFAKGVRNGTRVSQGDVIGYVGATGLATGPHLHYELRVNGEQRDPSKIALPTAPPIAKQHMAAFHRESKSLVSRMDILSNTNYASLN
ncbi:MAG: peptidoglycan DD-metalloendopeptidase family protein [Nitrosomonas sp.]|nr:peptidoglycan DD-metalloendopeptidase family protein [Nitrosomonas sp.]MDP1951121.1 peptidoglycan DD-metalloendopeptidase family protein [Nitrosomonas sp.]